MTCVKPEKPPAQASELNCFRNYDDVLICAIPLLVRRGICHRNYEHQYLVSELQRQETRSRSPSVFLSIGLFTDFVLSIIVLEMPIVTLRYSHALSTFALCFSDERGSRHSPPEEL